MEKTEEGEPESQEERIAWLRARGIEIDIPRERLTKPKSSGLNRKVKIVKIPYDEKLPYTEISISVDNEAAGDQLLSLLRIYFRSTESNIDMEKLKETASKQFGNDAVNVREETLRSLGSEGSVEAFSVAQPCPQNGYNKVSFYLDEVGQLKHLPPNPRASAVARGG
jgi:hypothetical protein